MGKKRDIFFLSPTTRDFSNSGLGLGFRKNKKIPWKKFPVFPYSNFRYILLHPTPREFRLWDAIDQRDQIKRKKGKRKKKSPGFLRKKLALQAVAVVVGADVHVSCRQTSSIRDI